MLADRKFEFFVREENGPKLFHAVSVEGAVLWRPERLK
jgi:hypothetical protein